MIYHPLLYFMPITFNKDFYIQGYLPFILKYHMGDINFWWKDEWLIILGMEETVLIMGCAESDLGFIKKGKVSTLHYISNLKRQRIKYRDSMSTVT